MTAKKTTTKPRKKSTPKATAAPETKKIPASMWFFNFILAAGFLGFLYYLKDIPETSQKVASPKPAEKASVPPAAKPKPAETKPFPYDYAKILPKAEVIPPNVKEYEPKEDINKYVYRLQTGSFRRREDAEKQKASIAFLGMRGEIKELRQDNGNVWYRVEVGPITSRSKMNKAVDKLVKISIQPLVRKEKVD